MRVDTCRFGELDINPETVISLDEGLLGFGDSRRYCLLEHHPESPFQWLQSLEEAATAFVVIDPLTFFPDYQVEIDEAEAEALGLSSPDDAAVLNIVTIAENYPDTTVNLIAPVVVNTRTRKAKQVILSNEAYTTRHRLMDAAQAKARQDAERSPAQGGE